LQIGARVIRRDRPGLGLRFWPDRKLDRSERRRIADFESDETNEGRGPRVNSIQFEGSANRVGIPGPDKEKGSGYGENPKVPLSFVALASQKSGMVLRFL
jgi:hypothetical protein